MKKIALATSMLLAIASGSAMAHGDFPGYVTHETEGYIIKTPAGECIKTPNWTADFVPAECGGTAAPAVEEEMAKPAEPKMVEVEAKRKFAVYFDFNSTKVGSLSSVIDFIKSLSYVESVKLVGYADRIGSDAYNQKLSLDRATAVASELKGAGVTDWKLRVDAKGETAPVANCTGKGAQLIACLRPDRRVDIEVAGEKTEKQM
ncbi:OmpA family protein [Marinobacterium sp. xm-d-530]|jgi:OOP family OmpA-OmpF porin|uniref:OmpA family protein n=1 Tax=Marinobacterium sp. xm-d-530 TaxID=2497747 RepID=UPI0015692916|nr:OmpA family protein [Marinobacterium sp. xm-d-530]NRQ02319.1 Outer membrane protein A precursor [Marinobacterium sp. xm-d-530]